MSSLLVHSSFYPWPIATRDGQYVLSQRDPVPYEHMVQYAPDDGVKLWEHENTRALCEAHYPEIWNVIRDEAWPTKILDVTRWLFVYHFGGVYCQYGLDPLVPMADFMPSPGKGVRLFTEFVLSAEEIEKSRSLPYRQNEPEEPDRVCNQIFAATPKHPFIKSLLDLILDRCRTITPSNDYDILYISSTAAVSTAYARFGRSDPTVELISRDETKKFIKLRYRGSWRRDAAARGDVVVTPSSDANASDDGVKSRLLKSNAIRRIYHRVVSPHVYESAWPFRGKDNPDVAGNVVEWLDKTGVKSVFEVKAGVRAVVSGAEGKSWSYSAGSLSRHDPSGATFFNPMYMNFPRVDVVVLGDFLEFIPMADGVQVMKKVRDSGARYVIAAHHPLLNHNWDTPLGDARPVNMEMEPWGMREMEWVVKYGLEGGRTDRVIAGFKVKG